MKYMQLLVKTIPFYLPPHYKFIWPQGEQDKQYCNKIAIKFLKLNHNANMTGKGFPIEMYMRGLPHEVYFIVLILQGQIIMGFIKKMVTSYVVGDLVLLD